MLASPQSDTWQGLKILRWPTPLPHAIQRFILFPLTPTVTARSNRIPSPFITTSPSQINIMQSKQTTSPPHLSSTSRSLPSTRYTKNPPERVLALLKPSPRHLNYWPFPSSLSRCFFSGHQTSVLPLLRSNTQVRPYPLTFNFSPPAPPFLSHVDLLQSGGAQKESYISPRAAPVTGP